jgi:hypothetical protein
MEEIIFSPSLEQDLMVFTYQFPRHDLSTSASWCLISIKCSRYHSRSVTVDTSSLVKRLFRYVVVANDDYVGATKVSTDKGPVLLNSFFVDCPLLLRRQLM